MDLPSNPFAQERELLLRTVLSPLYRGPSLYFVNSEDCVLWKPGPCYEYLHLSDDLLQRLFVATHLTSGPTGRETELASKLIRNVAGGSMRNVLYLFNIFLSMGTHNKTSHVSNEDKNMVRAPWQGL